MTALVILALVALFVGLRLYSVLGERTGHEQTVKAAEPDAPLDAPVRDERMSPDSVGQDDAGTAYLPLAGPGVRALLAADPGFDVARFLDGAEQAYRMILEAFWKGDLEEVRPLVDDNVYEAFAGAVEARKAEGLTLDNRLVAIDQSLIAAARLEDRVAEVTVRFEADIAAVTRNADGEVVAGSLSDAVQTRDRWTFRRDISASDPNWILVETDEEE
ncbi:Tim44/TimA family putative adaptor protein [Sphingomicrobium lutaoense]|uniref:Putative lipid-binding transport protein (Tim44 family) n=1 Tax=Sphingomicrobium lutaoense TaxID=515949 RepID=A0A839Z5F8_9SPHN|nr:Tim44/TimA family putative adaptor protein [Sphingomicrobium lutaoense]MBB3763914.1 putative lipid-binding transport protein (Tim44 family) [Sphingomicrobium lutaoense]